MLDGKQAINFWVADYVRYSQPTKDLSDTEPIVLHSWNRSITSPVGLDKQLDTLIDALRDRHFKFNRNLSDLVVDEIIKSDLHLREIIPLARFKFLELPTFLDKNHAIINVKNIDNQCFGYVLLSALHPRAKNPQRPLCYQRFFAKEGLDQLHYPVTHDQIPAIEDKLKVCINLFTFWDDERNARTPFYI